MSKFAFAQTAGGHFHYIRAVLRLRIPLAWATIGFAILGLIASFADVGQLWGPIAAQAVAHPLSALCLGGLGVSLLYTQRYRPSSWGRLAILAFVITVCAARLMDAVLSMSTGTSMGGIFGPIAGFAGTFDIQTAICIGAFAAGLLMRQGSGRLGGMLLVTGVAGALTSLLGAVFGVTFFNSNVSVITLFGMLSAACGMVSAYIHRPVVRAIFLLGDVGSQARVMAAAVVCVPLAAAGIVNVLRSTGGLIAFEVAMLSAIIVSLLVIVLSTSARHENSVASRRRAEREIALQSRTDQVTGTLNRFGITEAVEGAWIARSSAGAQFGMILVDLDYFRKLDATFGQDDGEAVLARVAQTLQPLLRDSDAMGRWGADEFLILLRIKESINVEVVAGRLWDALADVSNPFCAGLSMAPASIDAPFGQSVMSDSDDAPTDAIQRADTALHLAKTAVEMAKDAAMVTNVAVDVHDTAAEEETPSKHASAA